MLRPLSSTQAQSSLSLNLPCSAHRRHPLTTQDKANLWHSRYQLRSKLSWCNWVKIREFLTRAQESKKSMQWLYRTKMRPLQWSITMWVTLKFETNRQSSTKTYSEEPLKITNNQSHRLKLESSCPSMVHSKLSTHLNSSNKFWHKTTRHLKNLDWIFQTSLYARRSRSYELIKVVKSTTQRSTMKQQDLMISLKCYECRLNWCRKTKFPQRQNKRTSCSSRFDHLLRSKKVQMILSRHHSRWQALRRPKLSCR